ncbi:MAG: alkaline phosphatase [Gammaproteobacteria bacterium]
MNRVFLLCALSAIATVTACTTPAPSIAPTPAANNDWFAAGAADVAATAGRARRPRRARNVILFVGDGMSLDTITSARILAGQSAGGSGEDHQLTFEKLPHTALMKTYTTDMQVPDSAGTATAMLGGVKTRSGFVGVGEDAAPDNCTSTRASKIESFLELMETRGKATGVISTARITHATPAAAYAHVPKRGWEIAVSEAAHTGGCIDIATQLADFDLGDGIEVVLGGGRGMFLPADMSDPEYPNKNGARVDGRNLIDEWQTRYGAGARFVWNATQLAALDATKTERIMGLFEPSHMMFEADRRSSDADEPSLAELTGFAIKRLQQQTEGYFLLVEGGRIDHAHHGGNAARALHDTVALDMAVKKALSAVDLDDTLVIVTADHGHVLSFSGYPRRGNPILGKVAVHDPTSATGERLARDANDLPYTTLSYGNGPGYHSPRRDLENVDTTDINFQQDASVPLSSETHSGTDVIVFADGPSADLFRGVHEQNYVYHVMRHAVGL